MPRNPPTFLIGGGWTAEAAPALYGPLLEVAAGSRPTVACVVVDDGDGAAQFARWAAALHRAGPCQPVPVLVPVGTVLDTAALGSADALLVCGGPTPAYADALAPAASALRHWLRAGSRPYAGFSAGAVVAAERAVVGGWRSAGTPVCPQDASEDLDEVTVVTGIGLLPFAVDVHAAQWGTIGRLMAAVSLARLRHGLAIDEDTLITVEEGQLTVSGTGQAHLVTPTARALSVERLRTGRSYSLW